MFGVNWRTSPRRYDVRVERHVSIVMDDGVELDAQVYRPDSDDQFPALLGVHAYDAAMQTTPSLPRAMNLANAQAEAGDPHFYARRGYVHVIVNARGTGASGGDYSHYGPRDVDDVVAVIEWMAAQPWCTGAVGMFGVSYFAVAAKQVAARNPEPLKAVFAPFGYTDFYRDKFYHGGILARNFVTSWTKHLANARVEGWSRKALGEEEYARRLEQLRADPDITAVPELAAALAAPDANAHPLIIDVLMNPEDGPYWHERNPDLTAIRVPIVLGACWGMYGLHLPGEFRAWKQINAPKKLIVGPPIYLNRPVYQYAEQSLRWFDHWLKGNDTGYLDEPPVQLFLPGDDGKGSWLDAHEWPLPHTTWHSFYLHREGLLSEHEHWPYEGASGYEDNTYNGRGAVTFTTPPLVERTELVGPATATVYAATTADELLLFLSLWVVDVDGNRHMLTRGWLRGSLREVDEARSEPWLPEHPYTNPKPVTPDAVHRYEISLAPTAHVFTPGQRIQFQISSGDLEQPERFVDVVAQGHLLRRDPSWISILHDAEHPSELSLPITNGNRIGTYLSAETALS
ncbi:CocE/NonD family hydrolase [Nocardia vinacea]|uniref:CocE/NonD family hydrolase n=1 Tax=Nocardia vinacea TaxID=96468 RepID=A0ABZ1YLJ3_9NOCA|nr:CocE/NonD family hydrolase [Nocardia vinacea]